MDAPDAVPTVEPALLIATFAPSGQLRHCNEAWQSVLGTADAPWAMVVEDDKELANSSVLEAGKGTLVTNQVVNAHTPDRDEPLPVLLNFVPVHGDPQDDARITAVTISGEVMAEPPSWMISQTQRHRMEALGRMTMGVAHDLNNLLSGLIGHIELLKGKAEQEETNTDSIQPSIRTIEKTAEDGAALIEKLQRYIREDTQKHFERVSIASLVEDCITITQPYWHNEPRRQGIEIDVERALNDVPDVMGAPSELREVFVNLILNAVQAMPEGGTITFETFRTQQQKVGVRVEDTGMGMSDDVQKNIFEPLFTTKGEQGTGMGLAASYGIVQEHEGDIDVESEPGEGTTFTLVFPPADESEPEPDVETPDPTETASVRALVVDDEEMVRSIVNQLLSLNDHEVDLASSGNEALATFEPNKYDIVFTDFGMPEMTGAELAERLHERQPDLPIILLTGYTDTETAVGEVNDILSKPFKLEELEAAIQKYVFPDSSS
jgi:signal transduction histidine kinase/CheY-like chemotaxis protein